MSDIPPAVPAPTPTPAVPPPAPTPPADPTPPASFTQADLDRIVGERIGDVKRNHADELAKLLGTRSEDEVAAIVAAHDEQVEKDKSDLERATEAAARAVADAQEATARAQRAEVEAKLTTRLAAPGNDAEGKPLAPVQQDFMATVLQLAMPHALASQAEDPIADAVEKVRAQAAPMFTDPSSPSSNGNGSARPAPTPGRTHREGEPVPPSSREATEAAYRERNRIPDPK